MNSIIELGAFFHRIIRFEDRLSHKIYSISIIEIKEIDVPILEILFQKVMLSG